MVTLRSSAAPEPYAIMPLPPEIKACFWEYDSDALAWPDSKETIVPKLLRDGGQTGIDYLRNAMSDAELRDWALSHDIRGIPPTQLRRLERQVALPAAWVNERIARYENSVWGRRTGR